MYKNLDIKTDIPILPIGAIAESLGIHQRTLRIYDEQGILVPKRTSTNRRHYTLDDLEKAKLIQFLTRNLALNLSGVKLVLAIMEQQKISPADYISYVNEIAKKAHIDSNLQDENLKKTSKRGRKPSKSNS